MKKLLFTISMLLCTVIASATAIFNGQGQGTESSPYQIWNLDRLNEVRNFVGDEGAGVYFRLETNLDLTDYLEGLSWEAIGTSSEPFKGVFLGNGKKITGLIINSSSNYQGFFGYISGATIQNLTIEGTVTGGGYVGGIVGGSSGTNTIKSCVFNGNVTGSGSYVGGIAGYFTGTLNSVTHTGTTKGAGYVGGIVGQHELGSMTTATNTGNVTATTSSYAGGIVGLSQVAISSANNKGTVTGKQYTGGMAGSAEGSKNVTNSSADGSVTGTNYTGGLIGYKVGGTVSSCSSIGLVSGSQYTGGLIGSSSGSINNSRHGSGTVTGTSSVGGLIGQLSAGSVTSCFVYANITGTSNVGGIVGVYSLGNGNSPKIASSGYYGNISAKDCVGGILGQITYTGDLSTTTNAIVTHQYKTYADRDGDIGLDHTYTENLSQTNNVVSIYNCAAVGDVIGTSTYVGGIIGKGIGGEHLVIVKHSFPPGFYDSSHNYWGPCYYMDGVKISCSSGSVVYYYDYTLTKVEASLTNNYFSGNLKGTDYVGGVAGYMHSGTVERNYSYAAIAGTSNVGGIVGYMQADLPNTTATIASNVQLNSTITASSKAGKIYGAVSGTYYTITTSGTSINKSLNTTNLIIGGVTQETSNDAQNGTLQTQRMLLQSTAYSGLGWNFDTGKEWTSEESVSYPYKQWQTAPPTIKNGAVKGSTAISGTCTDNGTVYVTIEGSSTVYQATCSGGNWSLTVPTLKSGVLIRTWSKSSSKEQSYHTATPVGFPGSGTEADPWLVYDAYDLQGVNKAGYYKQMNDINLASWISANSSTKGWVPVGYSGTDPIVYDGDNHKVTELWVNSTENYAGLFSNFSKGTIRNLTVETLSSKQVKGGDYVGIVIGRIGEGTIENVTAIGKVLAGDNVGGIAGYTTNTTLNQLSYTGQLTATGDVGGLTSRSTASVTNCKVNNVVINASGSDEVGGLVALANNDISNCKVSGTISLTGSTTECYVGGLVSQLSKNMTECYSNVTISNASAQGYAAGLVACLNSSATIKQCSSTGSVTSTGAGSYTGGIVANISSSALVENCYSSANVTGTGYVGGIAGYAKGSIKKSYATGSLLNTSDDGLAGGIVGYIEGSAAIIKGCGGLNKRIETGSNQWGWRIIGGIGDNVKTPEQTDNYGWNLMPILRNNATKNVIDDPYEGTAKTTEQLQQQSTYTALGWDFTDIWTMPANSFPELQWLATTAEREVTLGDLDGDGSIDVADIVLIIDVMAQLRTDEYMVAAADVNGDGNVDVADIVSCIDLMAAQTTASPALASLRAAAIDYLTAVRQDNQVELSLNNQNQYTAFQMTVTLPEGMVLKSATLDELRGENHQLLVRQLNSQDYLIMGLSMDKDVLSGNAGRLLTLTTDGDANGEICFSNAFFATPDAETFRLNALSVPTSTTGIHTVAFDSSDSMIFDLQGRKVNANAKSGLYIVNGKKVVVK